MKYLINTLFIFFIILNSVTSQAAGIKKWTDENGRTYYGDTPPRSAQTQTIKPHKRPTNTGKILPRLSVSDSSKKSTDTTKADEPDTLEPEQAKEACSNAKKDLAVIRKSSRIKLRAADGSVRYMTKDEIKKRSEHSKGEIEKFCQ